MSRARLFFILVFSVLLVGGSLALWAAMKDDGEEKVALSDVPARIIDAANEAVPGGKIIEVEKDVEDEVLIYDVVKVVDEIKYEIEITDSGIVLEVEKADNEEYEYADKDDDEAEDEDDADEEVALSDAPDVVIKVARAAFPAGKIVKVEQETENGETIYEVEMVVKYAVKITADGVLQEIEQETDDDEGGYEEGDVECECEDHSEKDDEEDD